MMAPWCDVLIQYNVPIVFTVTRVIAALASGARMEAAVSPARIGHCQIERVA